MSFNKLNSIVFLVAVCLTSLQAQQAVLSAGGKATGSGGSGIYAVGQIAYTSFGNTTGSVKQGVLQPVLLITAIKEDSDDPACSAYPNPAIAEVNLKIENRNLEKVSFLLYDLTGKVLLDQKVNSIETVINIENFNTATFLLKVRDGDRNIKTFRIVKIQ